jgi:uncharacterized membrane protein
MVMRKGTPRHRRLGDIYVGVLLFASASSLTIYTRHAFTMAHWFGVIAIVLAAAGFALGRWHGKGQAWKYGHIFSMVGSYYVLVGGGVNEVFLRVDALRPIFFHQRRVVGEVHGLLMLSFVLLILGFMLATAISAYRLSRRRRRDMQAAGSAA